MNGNGYKLLDMAGNDLHGRIWQEIAVYGLKWLELDGNGLKLHERLEMVSNDWKLLELAETDRNGCKWL